MASARALHYVLKIGNRQQNLHFFRNVLGMKVLRHEEFKEGCEATCNGPYDNRWSKTMIGYGTEASHFVLELCYNYGVKQYALGNDLGGITIRSPAIAQRVIDSGYELREERNHLELRSPDGYKFFVVFEWPEESQERIDPVQQVTLHVTDLGRSRRYWSETLGMRVESARPTSVSLTYGGRFALKLARCDGTLDRGKAFGRIAFAVPYDDQPAIATRAKEDKVNDGGVLHDLVELPTPGKTAVRVIILSDPDGHEICFVDDLRFTELSAPEADAEEALEKNIRKDPFQDKSE